MQRPRSSASALVCTSAFGDSCKVDALSWDVAGRYCFLLALMSMVWLLARLLAEWRALTRIIHFCRGGEAVETAPTKDAADDAVAEERKRVAALAAAGDFTQDKLLLCDVAKSFRKRRSCCGRKETVRSVRGVSVGVQPGECFGLLGVNGAGKTTTMRMITGDIDLGGGNAYLGGWSVRGNRDKARRHLGYCPQFDALPDLLTTRETLVLYARLRGVPPHRIQATVDAIVDRMCLEAHQSRLTQHLSGGNKRKLSTALSLIGEPDVVLLDEPSTGIDVGARRFLWDVLGEIRQSGHALVLTSHSMDECEVLCTRLTIMVSGEFRCLGSPLQLKDRFGGGYTLTIKSLSANSEGKDDACSQIRTFMAERLPMAKLSEENVGLFRYRLGAGLEVTNASAAAAVPLAEIFRTLESAIEGGDLQKAVSDYTLSQTSLEEVFLYFSQQADDSGA